MRDKILKSPRWVPALFTSTLSPFFSWGSGSFLKTAKWLTRVCSPSNLLRSLPALQADLIKRVSMTILQKIPRDVYAEIVSHAR